MNFGPLVLSLGRTMERRIPNLDELLRDNDGASVFMVNFILQLYNECINQLARHSVAPRYNNGKSGLPRDITSTNHVR